MRGMRYLKPSIVAVLICVTSLFTGITPDTSSHHAHAAIGVPQIKHIFYIMMENHDRDQIFGNTADAPFINQLASQYTIATSYYGVTHPSMPNYLATISGDFQGIWDDCFAGANITCAPQDFVPNQWNPESLLTPDEVASASATPHMFNGPTLVDQIETQKLTWKAYMQSMPSVGYTGPSYPINASGQPLGLYTQTHNPFEYFSSIRNDATRMENIVPLPQLSEDLASNNVPNFVWIGPDQCDNMHGLSSTITQQLQNPDCTKAPPGTLDHKVIALGDAFIQTVVSQIMSSPAWQEPSAIVIDWDENDYGSNNGCCQSPTGVDGVVLGGGNAPLLVINSGTPFHTVYSQPANHYTILGAIEDVWGLGCLAHACGQSEPFYMNTSTISSTYQAAASSKLL